MNFKKIVSLSPSVTEILFLLKSGRKVAGVTEQCRRMEQAKDKESVGSFLHPDVKKIVSLNPDLVITYKKIRDEFLSAELKKRNITVFIFAPVKVEEIFNEMEKIGSAAGSGDLAKSLTGRLRKRIDLVREKVSGRALPRVLRLMRGVPVTIPVTIPSPCSYQYDAIITAGGRPMFSVAEEARTQAAFEDVIRFDPQIIVRCEKERAAPQGAVEVVKGWKGWSNISAVKDKRIFSLSCELSCRAGARTVDSIEKMAEFFHPEVF